MTIYIDVVLLENLCMNYIILFATGYILKIKINHIRLVISALIGGVYSILAYTDILKIYSNFILKIILSIIMVYVGYKAKKIKSLIKQLVFFYLTSFVFGGCAFALLYFVKPEKILIKNGVYVGTYPLKIALLGGIVGFVLTNISFHFVKTKLAKKNIYYNINIYFEEKKVSTKALLDTGNMLKDPITSMPVIVVEKDILKGIIPEIILDNLEKIIGGDVSKKAYEDENLKYIKRFRLIPFSSLGKTNGMLLGFKASKIEIVGEENIKEIEDVIIGIYDNKLSKRNQYYALMGLELLDGKDDDEFNSFQTKSIH